MFKITVQLKISLSVIMITDVPHKLISANFELRIFGQKAENQKMKIDHEGIIRLT